MATEKHQEPLHTLDRICRGDQDVNAINALANQYLFSGQWTESILWSALASFRSTKDWEVIRFATALAKIHGDKAALALLLLNDSSAAGPNYKYAVAHFRSATGDWHGFKLLLEDSAEFVRLGEAREKIDISYILKGLQHLLDARRLDDALLYCQTFLYLAERSTWAFTSILKSFCRAAGEHSVQFQCLIDTLRPHQLQLPREAQNLILVHDAIIEDAATALSQHDEPALFEDFRRFLKIHPHRKIRDETKQLIESNKFLSADSVMKRVQSAIENKLPLSLLRIGDGEGRFLLSLEDFKALKSHTVEKAKQVWFWNSTTIPGDEFYERLRMSYVNADIVGLTPLYRIDRAGNEGILGTVGVFLGNEFLWLNRDRVSNYTNNWVNVDLDRLGLFRSLEGKVNFISPHPKMREIFSKFNENCDIECFQIPSENHPALVGNAPNAPHFPDVFDQCMQFIAERPGQLFLIAAGVFAKIYCDEVRRNGGIAIDIGSLADVWANIKTR